MAKNLVKWLSRARGLGNRILSWRRLLAEFLKFWFICTFVDDLGAQSWSELTKFTGDTRCGTSVVLQRRRRLSAGRQGGAGHGGAAVGHIGLRAWGRGMTLPTAQQRHREAAHNARALCRCSSHRLAQRQHGGDLAAGSCLEPGGSRAGAARLAPPRGQRHLRPLQHPPAASFTAELYSARRFILMCTLYFLLNFGHRLQTACWRCCLPAVQCVANAAV